MKLASGHRRYFQLLNGTHACGWVDVKKGGRPTALSYDLLTQAELGDQIAVAVDVLLGQVVEQAAALTDHLVQAAAGVVVLLVFPQVLGQGVDPGGEDSDLDLGRTGVAFVGSIVQDDLGLLFLLDHGNTPPFKNIIQRLSRYYNVSITCTPEVAQKCTMGKLILFDDIEQVMKTFSLLYDVQCTIEAGSIKIE